jgi:hypothetical protein
MEMMPTHFRLMYKGKTMLVDEIDNKKVSELIQDKEFDALATIDQLFPHGAVPADGFK